MTGRIPARAARLAVAILASVSAMAFTAGVADAAQEVIYNDIPASLPGNFASVGFEATSTSEFGGQVEFAGTARKNPKVTVAMSTWACQIGGVSQDTCETPKPGKKFKWPITLNLYEVGPSNSVGTKIGSVTKTFAMPYRPSEDDTECAKKGSGPGTWFDKAENACYHGMAFTITFKVPFEVRGKAIVSLAYNTSTYGSSPAAPAPCNKTSSGCYYDSLNVATAEPAENTLTVGKQPTEDVYVDSNYEPMFCEGGTKGTFGPANCPGFWEGDQPIFEIIAK